MLPADTLRRVLALSLALAALLGGDVLHSFAHDGELRPSEVDAQVHGDDCEHGVDVESTPHDAHCLYCSNPGAKRVDLPAHCLPGLASAAPIGWHTQRDTDLPSERTGCAPLGARAPPQGT
ncbi:MAG: hypothetical protein DHS20C15_27920 [Planctomycetota bacterium]|nr:MAG: hypothetical protein DHS20C15_27920 [Planctomycetota bacterium]